MSEKTAVAWDISLGNFRLGSFAWELSLGTFRLGTFAWDLSLGNFRLGNWAPEAGGTGLLRLGEPTDGYRGNPGGAAVIAWSLRRRVRTLLGKPGFVS
jgi:hypothetical protein